MDGRTAQEKKRAKKTSRNEGGLGSGWVGKKAQETGKDQK
jgi:hypothetical protein